MSFTHESKRRGGGSLRNSIGSRRGNSLKVLLLLDARTLPAPKTILDLVPSNESRGHPFCYSPKPQRHMQQVKTTPPRINERWYQSRQRKTRNERRRGRRGRGRGKEGGSEGEVTGLVPMISWREICRHCATSTMALHLGLDSSAASDGTRRPSETLHPPALGSGWLMR